MDCPEHNAYDYRGLSLLVASYRIQHTNKVIESAMESGSIVLSDRYFYSCLANLRARGFDKDKWIYEIAETIIQPDIAFFFDVSVITAVKRIRNRVAEKNRYIDMDLQYRLREEYIAICKANGGILISTEKPEDKCYAFVKQTFERVKKK